MRFIMMAIGVIVISLATNSTGVAQTVSSIQETRQIAYIYGTCAVRRHAGGASKAVLSNVDSLTLRTHYTALIDPDCLTPRSRLVFPGDFYLYALADALVARELATAPVPDLSNVPAVLPRSMPPFAELKRKYGYDAALAATRDAELFGALNKFGECVVREHPSQAKALLMTEPESTAESSRFAELQPALASCLTEGKTMNLTKLLVRGTIALNYYRLAQAALHIPIH